MLIFSIKIWYYWRLVSILPNKTRKTVVIFFKTKPNVCIATKRMSLCIWHLKSKETLGHWYGPNKKKRSYYLLKDLLFSQKTLSEKVKKETSKLSPKLVEKTYQNTQDTSQVILNVSYLSIFFQDLPGFSKWKSKVPNIQRLTVNS